MLGYHFSRQDNKRDQITTFISFNSGADDPLNYTSYDSALPFLGQHNNGVNTWKCHDFFKAHRTDCGIRKTQARCSSWGEGMRWTKDRLKHSAPILSMLFTFHSIGPQTLHFPNPRKMASRMRQFLSRNPHSLYIFCPIQLKARKSAPSVSLVCKVAEHSEHYPQGISTYQASIDYPGTLQELRAHSWIHYSGNISSICFWWPLQTHIEKPLIWSQTAFLFWWVEGMCIQASTVIPGRALGQRGSWDRREVWRGRGNRGDMWQLRISASL